MSEGTLNRRLIQSTIGKLHESSVYVDELELL